MAKQKKLVTAGEHPGVIVPKKLRAFKSMSEACHETGVSNFLTYDEYAKQAPEFGIPVRKPPEGVNVYFGVNDKKQSLVFLEQKDGSVVVEPACALHVCDKKALAHQINTGWIKASNTPSRRFAREGEIDDFLGGPTLEFGVPPLIRNVAMQEIIDGSRPRFKEVLGVSFIHLIKPSPETEFLIRTDPVTPEMIQSMGPEEMAERMLKWEKSGGTDPRISPHKFARQVSSSEIAATIIADPHAFDIELTHPDPLVQAMAQQMFEAQWGRQKHAPEKEVERDIARYSRILSRKYPRREILVARSPTELEDCYRRFWIHL